MKKIAIISEHASPLAAVGGVDSGGQNVYVEQVARHLAQLGYAVDVFTRRDAALPEIQPWIDGVRVIHVPAGPARHVPKEHLLPLMPEFAEYAIRFMKDELRRYDLVHANFWMSGWAAAEIKRALQIPFVITFHALGRVRRRHQGEADGFPDERFEIEDQLVAEADRIIAECPQDEADLAELYSADPAKISMVPCGYNPEDFFPIPKAEAKAQLELAPDEPVVLQLGRMVARKGVDTVIRGFARMRRDSGTKARLLIVGGERDVPDERITPEIGRLRRIAQQEGVADRVTFAGRRSRQLLRYFYSAADVFVTTPWYEPFGITPLEAMACATPVIGSDVGGIKYSVRDGYTGYLVPPSDPGALAERLGHLLRNRVAREFFGRQGYHRAKQFFTWRRVALKLHRAYDLALRPRPVRGPLEWTPEAVSAPAGD